MGGLDPADIDAVGMPLLGLVFLATISPFKASSEARCTLIWYDLVHHLVKACMELLIVLSF